MTDVEGFSGKQMQFPSSAPDVMALCGLTNTSENILCQYVDTKGNSKVRVTFLSIVYRCPKSLPQEQQIIY